MAEQFYFPIGADRIFTPDDGDEKLTYLEQQEALIARDRAVEDFLADVAQTADVVILGTDGLIPADNLGIGATGTSVFLRGDRQWAVVPGAVAGTHSVGISNVGNTAGSTGLATGTAVRLMLVGGANVTLSQSSNGGSATVSIIGGGGGAAGTQTHGMSNLGNSSGTSGVATGSAVAFFFAGGNNVTLSQSINGASGTITISGPNTAAQSVQTIGVYGSSQTTGASSSSTVDARSVTLVGAGQVSVGLTSGSIIISATTAAQTAESQTHGMSNLGNTSGTTGVASGAQVRLLLAGGANITLSQSVNGASATITILGTSGAAQTVQTLGIYGSSQTAGASSSSTHDARSLTIVGAGANSVGWTNGSLLISAPNTVAQSAQSLGLYASSNTVLTSSGTADARSLSFRGVGGVSIGISGSEVLISGGAGAAQTNQTIGVYASSQTYGQSSSSTYDARTLSIVGSGGISVGNSAGSILISGQTTVAQTNQSLGVYAVGNTTNSSSNTMDARTVSFGGRGILSAGLSGSTIQISAPGYASRLDWNSAAHLSSATSLIVNTSVSVIPIQVPWPLSVTVIEMPVSISVAVSATANTAANVQSWFWGLYTSSGSTLSPLSAGSSTVTYTWASNTGRFSSLTGGRMFSFAMASNLTPGEYYFGVQVSTASGSSVGTATTALSMSVAPIFGTTAQVNWRAMDAATAGSINDLRPWQGGNSVSMSHTSQTMQLSQMTHGGNFAARANVPLILRAA